MKKTMVRIVAALLVAMLALTLLPMGAFAISQVDAVMFENKNPTYNDYLDNKGVGLGSAIFYPGDKLKVETYDKIIEKDDELYDFKGFGSITKQEKKFIDWIDKHPTAGPDEIAKIADLYYDEQISFKKADIKLPQIESGKEAEWWTAYGMFVAGYAPHQHSLSRWYSDGTTHWKECLTCKKFHVSGRDKFMYQNWCQDGDEDGICNICGGDVPYHDITVIEEEGGKITVNRDNACHRMKITADVEPAEGYKLKKLHFTKIRDDGSEQEITRHKKNGQFWTYMPTYELEVSAEFVKVKTKK